MACLTLQTVNHRVRKVVNVTGSLPCCVMLEDCGIKTNNIVTTPGAGFGRAGEGFIRISAFNSRENVLEAIARISD